MRALIIDQGNDRGSLAAARALHADGWEVATGSPFRGLTAASRAVARWHEVPAAEGAVDELVAAVNAAIAVGGYEVVFSSDDAGVMALSQRRGEIDAVVPYAAHEVVLRSFDKLELTRAAQRAGLAVPETREASDEVLAEWRFPAVVKPRLHTTLGPDAPGRLEAVIAEDRQAAVRRAAEIREVGGVPLVQELVPGTLTAFTVVTDRDGAVVAQMQQESERVWPAGIGVSARARTLPIDRALSEGVAALVRDLGWFGLAQLQFFAVPGSEPRLLDFNGRFYGSLALGLAAGVNLPALWARLATDRPLLAPATAAPGVRYQWFPRDLRATAAVNHRGRAVQLADVVRRSLTSTHSVWSARDPWPAIRHYSRQAYHHGAEWILPRSSTG